MKKIIAIAAVMVSVASFAADLAQVNFANKVSTDVVAPVSIELVPNSGVSVLAGSQATIPLTAELNIVGAGGSLTPFTPTTTFRGTPVSFQGYINAITANAPAGFNIGQTVTVRMTAWETAKGSYATAKETGYSGFSNDISVTLGGGTTVTD